MNDHKMQIPNNVTDLLMDDCVRKHAVENAVRGCFLSCGYREVSPAGLEFYDTFAQGVGAHSQQEMVKTFDSQGRILVMRPEYTIPIARLAGSKLAQEALPAVLSGYGLCESFAQECPQARRVHAGRCRADGLERCAGGRRSCDAGAGRDARGRP